MKTAELYQCFLTCSGISTDTRNIQPNSLFFALKGENFDANNFAEEALKSGAKFVVMDNKKLLTDEDRMFWVPDSLKALQDLAKYHREQLGLPVISLTGSNGKTTTKELIHAVLSKKYTTVATKGNLNNHIGVPLTLLSIPEDADLAIIEMGANHQHEIEALCQIAQPDFGYITNFGRAHLEGFGGFEGVIKGKSELYDYLRNHHKTAFVNANDELQLKKSEGINRFTYSIKAPEARIVFQSASAQPMAEVTVNDIKITSQLTGLYNIPNICAAVSIGFFFNVPAADIQEAIAQYTPNNNRSQWLQHNGNKVLLDAYNANPSSMKAAIENFAQLNGEHKLCILGDMFELGGESEQEHASLVALTKKLKLPCLFVGSMFSKLKDKAENQLFFLSFDDLVHYLQHHPLTQKTILIKGSRGMSLERILPYI